MFHFFWHLSPLSAPQFPMQNLTSKTNSVALYICWSQAFLLSVPQPPLPNVWTDDQRGEEWGRRAISRFCWKRWRNNAEGSWQYQILYPIAVPSNHVFLLWGEESSNFLNLFIVFEEWLRFYTLLLLAGKWLWWQSQNKWSQCHMYLAKWALYHLLFGNSDESSALVHSARTSHFFPTSCSVIVLNNCQRQEMQILAFI